MDIITTTPKGENENSAAEAKFVNEHGSHYFRTFPRRPKLLKEGDKIYFVENGYVTGYGEIFEIVQLDHYNIENVMCLTTGRLWGQRGYWLIKYDNWTWLERKIPYKGFMGFRYIHRIPYLSVRLRNKTTRLGPVPGGRDNTR